LNVKPPDINNDYSNLKASGAFVEQNLAIGQMHARLLLPLVDKRKYKYKKRRSMKNVRTKKKKGGRRKKEVKKDIRAAVRFTKTEYFIVKEKAAIAGISLSKYIRRVAINEQIRIRLTEEETKISRHLVGISHNLNQIAKACHDEGMLKAMALFQNYRNLIDTLLQKLKP
jgi:predicted DNA binding CopG/RHH family protein